MWGKLIGGIAGKLGGNRQANNYIPPPEPKQDNTFIIVAAIVLISIMFIMINNK